MISKNTRVTVNSVCYRVVCCVAFVVVVKFVLDFQQEKYRDIVFSVIVLKLVSGMALCEYAAQVGGQCGASADNPGSSQCMAIAKCDKDIRSHLRSFSAGFADSTVKSEAGLLARAGMH